MTYNYRLDTPSGIHNIYHTNLLRPAGVDPFQSQVIDDWQPVNGQNINDGDLEQLIERIMGERRRGKGWQVRVKWIGYARPTWEPRWKLQNCTAYRHWRARTQQTREERPGESEDCYGLDDPEDATAGGLAVSDTRRTLITSNNNPDQPQEECIFRDSNLGRRKESVEHSPQEEYQVEPEEANEVEEWDEIVVDIEEARRRREAEGRL